MAFMSRLGRKARLGLAGLVAATALAAAPREAKSNLIIGYDLFNADKTPAGTNLVVNTPYKVGVWFNSTNQPGTKIQDLEWTLKLPSAGAYTNFMSFNGASLPNHSTSEDFFQGINMYYENISSNPSSDGSLANNVRDVQVAADGPTNTIGFVGWYDFTPTALATNKKFAFSGITVSGPSTGQNYSVDPIADAIRPAFNIIPEPSTLGLLTLIGGGLAAWRRHKSRNK